MRLLNIHFGEVDVSLNHRHRRVTENLLQRESIAAIANKLGSAGVPKLVRIDLHAASAPAQAAEHLAYDVFVQ